MASACYRRGGCAEIVEAVAKRIDARAFNPTFPAVFPRFVQHAIWRYCAQSGLAVCNGNRIDDRKSCGCPRPGCSAMVAPLQISEHQPGDAAKSSCVPAAIIRFAHPQPSPFCQGRSALPPRALERQWCCWLPGYVMACRYFDAEANLVTIHVEASKCRQRALDHQVGRRQTHPQIIRSVHDAAGQHEDIAIGQPVPLPLGVSLGPCGPPIERPLRQQHVVACLASVAVSRSRRRESAVRSIDSFSRSPTEYCMTASGKHQPSAIWAENMTSRSAWRCGGGMSGEIERYRSRGRARAGLCRNCRKSMSTDRTMLGWG